MRRVLARTRNRLDDGNKGNGDTLALAEPSGKGCWPNELKLSDSPTEDKTKKTAEQGLFAGARG